MLAQNAGKVVTHRQLLREVWGPKAEEQAQYLRVYMNHLRKKLGEQADQPRLLRNEPGIGYQTDMLNTFRPEAPAKSAGYGTKSGHIRIPSLASR